MTHRRVRLDAGDRDWLRALVEVPSVSPLEDGHPAATAQAQRLLREGAEARGFTTVMHRSSPIAVLSWPAVPPAVLRAARPDAAAFLAAQPSLVLAMGEAPEPGRTVVINAHIDTVGPHLPSRLRNRVLRGRGVVDDKGPAVAVIAGVAAAFAQDPGLAREVRVLVASVPGEEGGALGVYGTRWLVAAGVTGRLMLFAEPTGLAVLDTCSATMTPELVVDGVGSSDDHPDAGHNATIALGFLATLIAESLGPVATRHGAKLTIAGIHTGHRHNRVYGQGRLLINLAYHRAGAAVAIERELVALLDQAGDAFAARFKDVPGAGRLVEDWDRVVRLEWQKRGVMPLANRDHRMETVLARAGFPRRDGVADGTAFTCDAIWAAGPDRYVAACGPGSLDRNGAHTADEWVDLDELDEYADRIRRLVAAFAGAAATEPTQEA